MKQPSEYEDYNEMKKSIQSFELTKFNQTTLRIRRLPEQPHKS